MNILAEELNAVLEPTAAYRLLSDLGRRLYFPKGIVAQAAEAGEHAKRFNATIGMACRDGKPMIIPTIQRYAPELSAGEMVSYSATAGDMELRKLWKQEMARKNPDLDVEMVSLPVVVPGLTNGIVQVADLFLDAGDTVLTPDMIWDNYPLIFEERKGARIRTFPLFDDRGALNVSGLEDRMRAVEPKGKIVLLLNFPNNPTGYAPTRQDVERLTEAIRSAAEEGRNILVICDDAYFGLFYEENTYPQSVFAPLSGIHENVLAIKIDGSTKEDFVWGFRIGFMTFGSKGMSQDQYGALIKKLMGAIRSSVSNSSKISQSILIRSLKDPGHREAKARERNDLDARYRKLVSILADRTTGAPLRELPFNSGYFMTFRCEGISAEALRKELLTNEGIGTIALGESFLRIAWASINLEDLQPLYDSIFRVADRLAART